MYEKLARSYPQIRQRQQNIHTHIQYNHLWQAAIAGDRPGYDRETVLHDAVFERQAILDALNAIDGAAFKKALAELKRIAASDSLAEVKSDLIEREKRLARDIHDATDPVGAPGFQQEFKKLMGREPTPLSGEEVEKAVRELPRDAEVIALYKKLADPGPLPPR